MLTSNADEFGYPYENIEKVRVFVLKSDREVITTARRPSPEALKAYALEGYKFYEFLLDLRNPSDPSRKYEELQNFYTDALFRIKKLEDQLYELKKKEWDQLDSTDVREIR